MPCCIKSAAAPVTKGAAIEVPVRIVYPPPGAVLKILTAGAQRSGFCVPVIRKSLPGKWSKYIKAAIVAANADNRRGSRRNCKCHIRRRDEKPVAEFVASFDGSQNCKRPSTILPVGVDSMCNAQVPEVIKVVFELKERKYCRNG